MRPAPTQGCDYGASVDYRHCAECGTKRPVASLVEDGSAEKLLRCAEREFCRGARVDSLRRSVLREIEAALPFAEAVAAEELN